MKIYTKTGDKGKTSLFGGQRVEKNHLRLDAYGTVDELNSHIGLLKDSIDPAYQNELIQTQNNLFSIGALLATPMERQKDKSKKNPKKLNSAEIEFLEHKMDKMNEELPMMRNFVLPGGHPQVSICHIARCVCRRTERITVNLSHHEEIDSQILIYLNRLSDYLFVLARKLTLDNQVKEIPWKP